MKRLSQIANPTLLSIPTKFPNAVQPSHFEPNAPKRSSRFANGRAQPRPHRAVAYRRKKIIILCIPTTKDDAAT